MCLWNMDTATPVNRWPVQRTTDMKMTEDGSRFVTIGLDKCITVFNVDLESLKISEVGKIEEQGTITSLTLTRDGRHALVNVQELQELHLWDLEELTMVHKYSGQRQLTYIIRSTLGGHNESFVLSGSEGKPGKGYTLGCSKRAKFDLVSLIDNRVYIWSRDNEVLIEGLEGHENTVNCVSWCPIEPMQFVSASDDHTIRV